ncbi:hypothetical protein LEP1GSC199_3304 [Leptospira vanthielii serovar Holland str. Waz Holland = ATCC 700522]|uniref:Uncharacterized protein n=1 Tax=Leptospira vanthielii serovar Holland str. Waz Holland = ATCC 700522 TaxID=1218591 RepID=N1WAV4_9LEPT|nr:hypothetical protein LEP1GSC199_3304 [Leptospira vanthielii serovar Holland str. Waz Holland = ATCC 700522]
MKSNSRCTFFTNARKTGKGLDQFLELWIRQVEILHPFGVG